MFQFAWQEKYCVDGGAIDAEHQSLFSLANKIFAIGEPAMHADEIKETVKALFRHIEEHVRHEEDFMQEIGYPGRLEHKLRHEEMVAEMNAELRRHADIDDYVAALRTMMLDWIVRHVMDEDSRLADFLAQSQKVSPQA